MPSTSTRERIVTAAATVMLERGVAGATTKEIARAAGCSEALLYKHFTDKQQLFLAVLSERLPVLDASVRPEGATLADTLTDTVEALLGFFVATFPMSASIFGAPTLLAQHRDGVRSHGSGPEGPVMMVVARLADEQDAGRVAPGADLDAVARSLVGFAFHRAFLAAYEGSSTVPDARVLAARAVAVVLPALAGQGGSGGVSPLT